MDTFTMIDHHRSKFGYFVSDVGVHVSRSPNARWAKSEAARLRAEGYVQFESIPARDDNGHPTTASVWARPD